MGEMRRVQYEHTHFREDNESCEASLLEFLFDIPYFPPCGVFPPFHLLNQFLSAGGSEGGMSPGAIWEPFTVTQEEYEQVVGAIESTPLSDIKRYALYAFAKPVFDPELDGFATYSPWMRAACQKHRARYHREMEARIQKGASN